MVYTETKTIAWFDRIKASIKQIWWWFFLIGASLVALRWNEANYIQTKESLEELGSNIVAVSADAVDVANNGLPIHIQGSVQTTEIIGDEQFFLMAPTGALRVMRTVEMYQRVETTKTETTDNAGGSQTEKMTYEYTKEWRSDVIDSSSFKQPQTPSNPWSMPYAAFEKTVSSATVGAFVLSPDQIQQVPWWVKLMPTDDVLVALDFVTQNRAIVRDGYLMIGQTSKPWLTPTIWDIRISWEYVPATDVSIIAQQNNDRLQEFQTNHGKSFFLLHEGRKSADVMIADEQSSNTMIAWLIRIVGIVFCIIWFNMIFSILPTIASILPLFGRIVGAGISLVAWVLWFSLSFIMIAIAWVRFRPLIGIGLLIVWVWAGAWLWWHKKNAPGITKDEEPKQADEEVVETK